MDIIFSFDRIRAFSSLKHIFFNLSAYIFIIKVIFKRLFIVIAAILRVFVVFIRFFGQQKRFYGEFCAHPAFIQVKPCLFIKKLSY